MPPQFQRVVTLSVMFILVGLFTWIYVRDRQPRARLWMTGWACIVVHFAGMTLFSFGLIPGRLSDWLAYATLILAAAAFFLSVCRKRLTRTGSLVFWGAIVVPALAYWTCMVFDVQRPLAYRALISIPLAAGIWLALRESRQSAGSMAAWFLVAVLPGAWAFARAPLHIESGVNFLLFAGFAITGWCYWSYFGRLTPGVLLTSLSFLAWGLVFPVSELCAALQVNIPGDHVVWDLPKYFVAFGMIMTLFENQTEFLKFEVVERKRAEQAAQSANEAKGILMASTSFAAQRFLSLEDWQTVIPETLFQMGMAARVSRVYVARVDEVAGNPMSTVLHEWCRTGAAPGARMEAQAPSALAGEDWREQAETLRRGEVVSIGGQMGSSILATIEVSGAWFGFLGFEDRRRQRQWSEAERDALRSAARMLGASITRQRAQEYVDNILRSMEEALLVTDADLKIRRVNPSAERLLGYREEELLGRPAGQVIREREVPARRSAVERTYRTKSGGMIPVLFSSAELRNSAGATEGYVWLAQDVTEAKRIQAELVRAKETAEQANRAKSTFLANMSHELRTPLNAVIGYSEMLQEIVEDRGEEDLLPDLCRIRAAGKHLLGLINDVLDLSKIEAGKVELCVERLSVAAVIHDVVSTIQPLVGKNTNQLVVACEEEIGALLGDQIRVRQVLFNLLSNACKFTSHGLIKLEAKRTQRSGAYCVQFRVSDSGIGMNAEQLERLYRPFMQADASTTRKFGGTGLGLTISREYCLMMGGSLAAESALGKGSTFTVWLPAAETVETEGEPAAPASIREAALA